MARPSEYDPAYCGKVIELGKEGKSYTQIAVALGIAKDTLYRWRDDYPEFSDALTRAREEAQAWWEDRGQEGLYIPGFNASLWNKQVSCRFPDDYRDTVRNENVEVPTIQLNEIEAGGDDE
jgi:hypothetical protein